jgi:antitoxin HicB
MTYTVVLLREAEGGYSVSVPALKGCHTQGETVSEALEMARDAILCHTTSLRRRGLPVPRDVGRVAFDWGASDEALAYKVAVQEREEAVAA